MPRQSPRPAIIATCPVCGKEYKYAPSWPKKTCSQACSLKLRRPKVNTKCPECGKEFWYHQSWPRKYCSNTCKGKANVVNLKEHLHPPSRYLATCETCGKQYETEPTSTRGRFCSRRCYGDWQKGRPNHRKGKTFGRSKRLPPPIEVTCTVCGMTFQTKRSHLYRRRCCSRACIAIHYAQTTTGANNRMWKGGRVRYYGPSWCEARRQARARDKVCQECGKAPGQHELDVHHIIPFRVFGHSRHAEANKLENLVSLCKACHTTREWKSGRNI